jgi:hypothetical protein
VPPWVLTLHIDCYICTWATSLGQSYTESAIAVHGPFLGEPYMETAIVVHRLPPWVNLIRISAIAVHGLPPWVNLTRRLLELYTGYLPGLTFTESALAVQGLPPCVSLTQTLL